jgi:hypothetical protein
VLDADDPAQTGLGADVQSSVTALDYTSYFHKNGLSRSSAKLQQAPEPELPQGTSVFCG